jgi:hypothetical protein
MAGSADQLTTHQADQKTLGHPGCWGLVFADSSINESWRDLCFQCGYPYHQQRVWLKQIAIYDGTRKHDATVNYA